LSRGDLSLLWQQKGQTVREWLEQQAEEINGDVDLLTKIHEDTPDPESIPEYQQNEFSEDLISVNYNSRRTTIKIPEI